MPAFVIRMGMPEMEARWKELARKDEAGELDRDEERLFARLVKTFRLLEANPHHPGLNSHDIEVLSERYRRKVWQSYIENRKPAAGRLFWVYGPDKGEITIVGLEPHPDVSKSKGYSKVGLSAMARKK